MSPKFDRLYQWLNILVALSFSASIMLHLYTITFSRMLADDFCSAYTAQLMGPLRAAYAWYRIWSGRYSANLLDGLVGWLGASFYQLSIILLVLFWIAALYFCFQQLLSRVLESRARFASLSLALAVTATTLNSIPMVQQSIYWGQGMRALLPPLILLPLFVGILLKVRLNTLSPARFWLFILITLLFAFGSGGFSETGLVMQFGYAGIGLVAAIILKKRRLAFTAGAMVLGSLAALALMWFSPGRAIRQEQLSMAPDFYAIFSISWVSFQDWILSTLTLRGIETLSVFLVGFSLTHQFQLHIQQRAMFQNLLQAITAMSLLVIFVSFTPSVVVMTTSMPGRTMIIPQMQWMIVIMSLGALLGIQGKNRVNMKPFLSSGLLIVGISFMIAVNLIGILRTNNILREYQTYAAAWDQRDQFLRSLQAAGVKSVTIPRLTNPAYLDNLVNNPEYWVNACYSDYYGIEVLVPEN